MSALHNDIAAFDRARSDLEAAHRGEWAVFHAGVLAGLYPAFDQAAIDAVDRFGEGPYLIRQIGAEAIQLSAAMVFKPAHAHSPGRL